ncbi:unnamed protein product [Rhizophagus irregularis]|nr:unnamed protein product [Rhizophagus irregularis]
MFNFFELAHQSQHSLLKRDVLNVDKQDDGAALRTFHLNNLMQILVNGELCDAYLNRTIDHKTRIEMYGRIPEHVFGISRRILPDFNFYEFFKIQQRVSYRDKISRAGIIDTNRERNSAAGYIFDIEIIERIRTLMIYKTVLELRLMKLHH